MQKLRHQSGQPITGAQVYPKFLAKLFTQLNYFKKHVISEGEIIFNTRSGNYM